MIGWYVDVSCDPSGISVSSLNGHNISEITFADKKRPWTISRTPRTDTNNSIFDMDGAVTEIQNKLIEELSDDFYTLYAVPGMVYYKKTDKDKVRIYNEVVTSMKLSFPNSWDIFTRFYTDSVATSGYLIANTFVYFKTLSKGIGIYGNSFYYYSVTNDGTINKLFDIQYLGSTAYLNYLTFMACNSDNISEGTIGYYTLAYKRGTLNEDWFFKYDRVNDKRVNQFFNGKPDFNKDPGFLPDNPYDPINPSEPGGGEGTFDDESDLIPDSSLPTLSSANTGFTRIYNPTLSQVQDLARYLWTDETIIETIWNKIRQYFEDPMQAIIGFNLVPVPVPDAGTKSFALMYIDTGVDMNVAASQFVDRDCGILKIEPYYGSALDYAPHTKISIFLPFIGTVQLNTDEVMGRTLQVKYRVDICSGSCVAKVAVDGNFIYQFSGHCAIPIPISSADFSSYVGAAISVAKLGITAAVGAATGGSGLLAAGASQQTGNLVSTTTETNTARNPETGRQITLSTRKVETSVPVQNTSASFNGLSPANVSNTVGEIMSSKPFVEHSGSFSGNTGYLGVRRPFLIIERPNICLPEQYQQLNGYPSMITMELGTCSGYTVVQQVQLTGLGATNPEQAEILELLKGGVIF